METLPDELLLTVFATLDNPHDRLTLLRVCRRLRRIGQDSVLWRRAETDLPLRLALPLVAGIGPVSFLNAAGPQTLELCVSVDEHDLALVPRARELGWLTRLHNHVSWIQATQNAPGDELVRVFEALSRSVTVAAVALTLFARVTHQLTAAEIDVVVRIIRLLRGHGGEPFMFTFELVTANFTLEICRALDECLPKTTIHFRVERSLHDTQGEFLPRGIFQKRLVLRHVYLNGRVGIDLEEGVSPLFPADRFPNLEFVHVAALNEPELFGDGPPPERLSSLRLWTADDPLKLIYPNVHTFFLDEYQPVPPEYLFTCFPSLEILEFYSTLCSWFPVLFERLPTLRTVRLFGDAGSRSINLSLPVPERGFASRNLCRIGDHGYFVIVLSWGRSHMGAATEEELVYTISRTTPEDQRRLAPPDCI